MKEVLKLSLEEVKACAFNCLIKHGFSDQQAEAIAITVTAAERDECLSHGLFRIPFYIKAKSNDSCNASALPVVSENSSSVIHVDAKNGFCPLALQLGLPSLQVKAKSTGIAALAIHNAYNIAALWPEVEELAEKGFVGFAFTAANAYVAPHGGTKPLFGTNPMAFSWPRVGKPPLVFDQASSMSARGEIQLHAIDEQAIPETWAIDTQGNSTTNAKDALAGAQLPFGGHKGSSIALMVELLAGALIGDLFSYESTKKDNQKIGAPFGGEFVIAIDPAHTLLDGNTEAAQTRAEHLFSLILEQEGTRLPSDRRFQARKRTSEEGVSVSKALYDQIVDL